MVCASKSEYACSAYIIASVRVMSGMILGPALGLGGGLSSAVNVRAVWCDKALSA
jgi:hypothetical protein